MKLFNFKISTRLIVGIIAILVLVWVSTGGSYGLFGALTEGFKGRSAQKYQRKREKEIKAQGGSLM